MIGLQVDECGITVPPTLARMAKERSVLLTFGSKLDQWRIEADIEGEARVKRQISHGQGRAYSIISQRKRQQMQHASSTTHGLSSLQNAESLRSTTSRSSSHSSDNESDYDSEQGKCASLALLLDTARLALPISGQGREALQLELSKLQPIDDS